MQRRLFALTVAFLVLGLTISRRLSAAEGPIGGIDLGAAVPLGKLHDRADVGGVFSSYMGYMFNDYLGLTGQAQVVGAPNKSVAGIPDSEAACLFGAHAGPRLELPLADPTTKSRRAILPTLYLTGQAGVFTGLAGGATSGTSWGYSTGGGLNFRISSQTLFGGFARYNWVDQRVTGDGGARGDLKYITAGISMTFNFAAPPPPPPRPPTRAEAPPPPPRPKKIVLRAVHFDVDQATLRADAVPVLNEALQILQREGSVAIIVEGHTDSAGSEAYNLQLSRRRAETVRRYLVDHGVAPARITAEGLGESQPVAPNDTEAGRAQNRRVELKVQ
jgi:outer membrane protein OmpA-like peptidoglycan-associated protein